MKSDRGKDSILDSEINILKDGSTLKDNSLLGVSLNSY